MKKQSVVVPRGGMNSADHALDVPPERAILAYNYELTTRDRFRRVDGYERADGRARPSDYVPTVFTDETDYHTQLLAGIASRRAAITAVPGSGPVRGVAIYQGVYYAWRNNAGGTLLDCYQSTAGGWSKVVALSGKTVLTGTAKVRTTVANLISGSPRGQNLYIVDGTSYLQEWNGAAATNLATALTGFPYLVCEHKNHLFIAFPNGSLVNSATGNPTVWAGSGAAEIANPQELTALRTMSGGTLGIFCRRHISILYGSDTSDWQRQTFSTTGGAVLDSVEVLGDALMLDGADVTWLQRTAAFGDFNGTGISTDIRPLMEDAEAILVGSMVVRRKAQYRLILSDGRMLCGTFAGAKCLGWTVYNTLIEPFCATSGYDADNVERMLVGAEDGFVYEMDQGRSFDGEAIVAVLRQAFNHCGSPGQIKRFHEIVVEGVAQEDVNITMSLDFSYADSDESPESENYEFTIPGLGSFYDVGTWDEVLFDNPAAKRKRIPVSGVGTNVSLLFSSESAESLSHTISAVISVFSLRGRAS